MRNISCIAIVNIVSRTHDCYISQDSSGCGRPGRYDLGGFLALAKEELWPRIVQQDYVVAVARHASKIYIDASCWRGASESCSQARALVISIWQKPTDYKTATESLAETAGRAVASAVGIISLINAKVDFMCVSLTIVSSTIRVKSFEFIGTRTRRYVLFFE